MLNQVTRVRKLSKQIANRCVKFFLTSDFDLAEFNNALVAIGCAIVLVSDPTYLQETLRLRLMLSLAQGHQWIWAMVFTIFGTLETLMFFAGGNPATFSDTPKSAIMWYRARGVVLFMSLFVWGCIFSLFTLNGLSMFSVLFLTLSVGSLVALIRLVKYIRAAEQAEAIKKLVLSPQVLESYRDSTYLTR